MLLFCDMTPGDREIVLAMAEDFYSSPAALHPVDSAVLERDFRRAVDPGQSLLRGVLLREDGTPVGYLYLTRCWSTEAGGLCVLLEELYLKPEARSRGLGGEALAWLRREYPDARRFRLEVNSSNPAAARLYQRAGYRPLLYDQMIMEQR